ncbi:MAG: EscU/YscU/HrcU family type III secretion system export apparatus switch protein, partial [Hyphomicrobiaceae bacterium]
VITNPTHFAVALRYDADTDPAPVVVARGQDHLALRIREIAAEHDVPRVENKELARALYANAELDKLIPSEFFRAVAEIILFLSTHQSKRPT